MPYPVALAPGHVAVITGAASGIGLAVAERLAALGMKLALVDTDADGLGRARVALEKAHRDTRVLSTVCDVADRAAVEAFAAEVARHFGSVDFLMCNAGIEGGGKGVLGDFDVWRRIVEINLWGTIHVLQTFVPSMVERGRAGSIVVTGSKQGITCPPGNTPYNVSKSALKTTTEALAHELRNIKGCRLTVHLLIPGYTYTGLAKKRGVAEKPEGAWEASQVVDLMIERMAEGDFYILCPDNETTRAMDEKRMAWTMGDIIENRPPLSRWHPNYKKAFADYMKG
ncbi:MAG TPA: SDR family NAD(P)-dependent oxidoreductase [Stellaceae bacterium]|jgi:NAD(P)-dependent dehydrogenase (short-subunit alcohol dehydrogenase family)|nr:SDR family NAD(P)-dependent oxidoreductase [Stellaceae bacterium]